MENKKKLYYYIADSLRKNAQELVSKQFKKLGARAASWFTYDTVHTTYFLIEGSAEIHACNNDEAFESYVIENGINIVDLLKKDESKPTFKPFQKVLTRHYDNMLWWGQFYSHDIDGHPVCTDGEYYEQIIPYEGNEHLLGTSNNP